MNTQDLSRKHKRALTAKASRLYGLKGAAALAIHQAYLKMQEGDIGGALLLAHPVTQSHPGNPHGWILLGSAALQQREGPNARAFFAKAVECAPRDSRALSGLGKAHVLCAEVDPGLAAMERAIAAGSRDEPMLLLYLDLMIRMDRRLLAAKTLESLLPKIESAELAARLGTALLDLDESRRAALCLERAYTLAPDKLEYRVAMAQAHLYLLRLEEAEAMARELLAETGDDQAALVMLSALRLQRRGAEALEFAASHEFDSPEALAQARSVMANLLYDQGDAAAVEIAYQDAMHIAGEQPRLMKGYGSFLLRAGRYQEGLPYYARRVTESLRRRVPEANAAPTNVSAQDRLFIVGEQGIGDQVALLSLLRRLSLRPEVEVTLVGDTRFGPLLQGNALGLGFVAHDALADLARPADPAEMLLLGDLVRYLPEAADPAPYLVPDAAMVAELRARYAALSAGRPIFGMAWSSRSVIGLLRSIPLEEMVSALPEGAMVVSLQYGDTAEEIAAAQAVRPDLLFHSDSAVNQMADLAGFAAQIAALDRIVTIDNTTAHLAGALGHEAAHLLLPTGSECMWYWGESGSADSWYGALKLYRQARFGDWTAPLAALRRAL